MRPALALVQSQCVLCVFSVVCVSAVGGSPPPALPWPVDCPAKCVCQIKPWFSPDSVYHEAPTVDCNDLLLTILPIPIPLETHTLRLQSNLLSVLDTAELTGLPNLTDLDLSQNRFSHVRTIGQSFQLSSLLSLHLEENQLSHLHDASFYSLPTLQELFLSHNNLRSVAPHAFVGLSHLLRLHINNNRLTTVNPRWFVTLPRLEVLMLGGNPVMALPEKAFAALKSLQSLVLGGMGLRGLSERALEGLESLESLSFYDNHLTEVPTEALTRVPGLKFLDLNKNYIKVIETGDFRNMLHLKELGLNNMEELVSIERAALENLPELTKLEITNNPHLSYIHPEAFIQLSHLESLMLNSNSLSALHHRVMLSLPSLQEVSLHSNPLRCDCLFHWVTKDFPHPHLENDKDKDALTTRVVRFIQPQATLCVDPPELRGREVREVSSGEMSASCLPTIPADSLPSYVRVQEGGKLFLHCRALANPEPELFWVIPSGLRLGQSLKNATAPAFCKNNTTADSFSFTSDHSLPPQARDTASCRQLAHYKLLPEGTLEIGDITLGEAGLYTCVAENVLGADTRSVTVQVHGKGKIRKKGMVTRGTIVKHKDISLHLTELGEHYAVLSWESRHNHPSTRISWHAVRTDSQVQSHTTRILAGSHSYNLTQLQEGALYRMCLHLGGSERARNASRMPRANGESQCVSFRTKDVPKVQPGLQLDPHLTSTAVTLLLLALVLLLAGQGWDSSLDKRIGKLPNFLHRNRESAVTEELNQKDRKCLKQTNQSEKCPLQEVC